MKTFLIITVLYFNAGLLFSQTPQVKKSEPTTSQNVTISTEKKEQVQKRIAQIDSHLNSIQIKWDFILEHPEEKEVAEEKGWFDDMNRIKNELIEEKNRLLDLLD